MAIMPFFLYGKLIWTHVTGPFFQRKLIKHNMLYVIAHPDDEAMFFVPSIIALGKHNNLHMLCLSNGNADGLGRVREKELEASCKYLGF